MIYPGSPLVAITLFRTFGLPCDSIDDEIPADPATWAAQGFLHVPTTVGGSPAVHVPLREPVIQTDFYTNRSDSERAPWNRAEHGAHALLAAVQDLRGPANLTMPTGYYPVRVNSIWALTEPRRMPGDPSGFARVNADYEMRWVVLR